jgi:hypothetical protein
MPLSGTFSTMPFADLLQWLADARRSGTLAIALEVEERYLRFEEGRKRGLVDEPGLLAAITKQTESHMPLSDVLVASGAVDGDALEGAVSAHVEETVLSLFLWPEGRFTFNEAAGPEAVEWMPPEYHLHEAIDVRGILMEGMRRLDEWNRIVKVLPSDDVQLHALGPSADLPILEDIAAHPEPPTLETLLAEQGDSRYMICEQLVRAFERGLLAVEAGREPSKESAARRGTTVSHLVRAGEALLAEEQHDEAATLLRSALGIDPLRSDARALLRQVRDAQLRELYQSLPPHAVPRAAGPGRPHMEVLSPRERKVLAQINGRWDVAALAVTTAIGELETLRALRTLVRAGVVRLDAAPR